MTSFSFAYNRFTNDIRYCPATLADCAAVRTGDDPVTPNGISCGRCVASALIVTSSITHPRIATISSAATILTQLVARGLPAPGVCVCASDAAAGAGC